MESENKFTAITLPDDLVVEILSRVPSKSFCRFKCVCKAWNAFSSDQHYCQKLPKIPSLLHQGRTETSAIQLVSLSPNEQIDGALTFVPQYEQLELVDCCNGLVLCQYKGSYSSADTCSFIVCNPATGEWRTLPISKSHCHPRGQVACSSTAFLAFDPSWSEQFYVLNFREMAADWPWGTFRLEVFSSYLCTWLVYDAWIVQYEHAILENHQPHNFISGVLHVETNCAEILMVEGLEAMRSDVAPHPSFIRLPKGTWESWDSWGGCFGQSSGCLQCAVPEWSCRTIEVYSLDACHPRKWSLKHRLSMLDAFGRNDIPTTEDDEYIFNFYDIVALDSERGVLFLFEKETKKLLSYDIDTRKLSQVDDGRLNWPSRHHYYVENGYYHYYVDDSRLNWSSRYHYYVACYSKLPG